MSGKIKGQQQQQRRQRPGLSHEDRNFNLKTSPAERRIILGLESISDLDQRKAIILNLSPAIKEKLLQHLKSLVYQDSTHLVSPQNAAFIKSLLSPHQKTLKRAFQRQRGRSQFGAGIFTFVITTLVPIIAELVKTAYSK